MFLSFFFILFFLSCFRIFCTWLQTSFAGAKKFTQPEQQRIFGTDKTDRVANVESIGSDSFGADFYGAIGHDTDPGFWSKHRCQKRGRKRSIRPGRKSDGGNVGEEGSIRGILVGQRTGESIEGGGDRVEDGAEGGTGGGRAVGVCVQ